MSGGRHDWPMRAEPLSPEEGLVRRLPRWAPYAGLIVMAAGIYAPTIRYGFIGLDDAILIEQNQELLGHLSNAPRLFTQEAWRSPASASSGAYYRPLWILSFMVDAQIGGSAPLTYHCTNVLIHALNCCLLLAFLRAIATPFLAAFALAAFLAVHPVFAMAVAWIPGRNDPLLCLFVLAAMLCLAAHAERGRWRWYALHLLALSCALLTKEQGIVLVPMAWLFLVLVRGRKPFGRDQLALGVGWAAVVAVSLSLRAAALGGALSPAPASRLLGTMAANAPVVLHYLGKALLPVNLSVMPTLEDTGILYGLVALGLVAAALWRSTGRKPRLLLFAGAWYLLFVLPTLTVPDFVGLEPRLYVPFVGLCIIFGEVSFLRALRARSPAGVAILAVLLVFAILTLGRLPAFKDRRSFWEDAAATAPHLAMAQVNLGTIHNDAGRLDAAERHYRRALELNSREPMASNNLGVIHGRRNQLAEAEKLFEREIEVNPRYADAYFNLGYNFLRRGDDGRAVELWKKTLELAPTHVRALRFLADHLVKRGRIEEARPYLERLPPARPASASPAKP